MVVEAEGVAMESGWMGVVSSNEEDVSGGGDWEEEVGGERVWMVVVGDGGRGYGNREWLGE